MTLRRRVDLLPIASAILLATACAQPAVVAPAPSAGARRTLDDEAVTSLAELLRMEDRRVLDGALVSRLLAHPVIEVRERAVLAAGRIRDRAATRLLLYALNDSTPEVRAGAAFALGELADSSVEVSYALSTLALSDDTAAAIEAAASLGRIGIESGRAALDSILSRPAFAPALLHETLLVAWRLPRTPGTVANIARWTTVTDAETRWRAAYALARGGGRLSPAYLLPLIGDVDARVRAYAVRGLGREFADSAGVRERALAALLGAARDPHPHVRINAINLLAGYGPTDQSAAVLVAALNDSVANVAVAATAALGQLKDRSAIAALQSMTAAHLSVGLRASALHALVQTDSIVGAAIAVQWADSSSWVLRMHAARTLGRTRTTQSHESLAQLARDDHYLVATAALNALRPRADSLPGLRRIFIEQLGSAHPLVRAAAARGVAVDAGPADLDLLLQAYDRARTDSIRDAAVAIVNALARVRHAGVPVDRTFFLRFGSYGAPADPVLYRVIADSIGTPPSSWSAPAARVDDRPLRFYEDVVRAYVAPVIAGAAPRQAVLVTEHGEIVLELASYHAPLTVHNFITLIDSGYYAGSRWHRVVPNFVIQDGDPRGDGSGGPGYAIRDEINSLRYERGTLGMALSGPDTGGSQYFITHSPQPHLDGGYTVFGRVVRGMDVVDRVVQDDPILDIRVQRSPQPEDR